MERFFLGVDPGYSGGAAVIDSQGQSVSHQKCSATERDLSDFFAEVANSGPHLYATIEKVHSMPGQGVASSFKFGKSYGFLRGLLIAHRIRFEEVIPSEWQRVLRCRTGGDKNVSKAKAQELFPDVKVTHAIADALLIAEFGRRKEISL